MNWLGRLACCIGLHKQEWRALGFLGGPLEYRCTRCGKHWIDEGYD